jgi:Glycosyl transferase family 11.
MDKGRKSMVIVRLTGGLGNQMFQYAAARRIAHVNGSQLKLDLNWFDEKGVWTPRKYELDVFSLPAAIADPVEILLLKSRRQNPVFRRLPAFLRSIVFHTKQTHIIEKQYAFDPQILMVSGNIYLEGYWQSCKYFEDIETIIRADFTFKDEMDDFNCTAASSIQSCESVAVHIRRGDYVTLPSASSYHGHCPLQYYEKSIEYIQQHVRNPLFFVFSDDISWVRDNLAVDAPTHYIDHKGQTAHSDMRLMSLCRHHIIANSSFSWWGAWLAVNPEKIVIAPGQWFSHSDNDTRDLIPEGWKRIITSNDIGTYQEPFE